MKEVPKSRFNINGFSMKKGSRQDTVRPPIPSSGALSTNWDVSCLAEEATSLNKMYQHSMPHSLP
jgi:hypothetical protein